MYFIITLLSISVAITFMFMLHPLAMGFVLLLQTLLIAMLTGFLSKTFWFSYILFIVFLGGMLVLFIYVTSLASNEKFFMSMKILLMMLSGFAISCFLLLIIDNFLINSFFNTIDSLMFSDMGLIKENVINLNKLYNAPTNYLTAVLIIYLFLTLIIVVKVTNIFKGPLRART
uniref:NADH-ubiquinone oxidoreductase chain 6 n=1 Tax=Austrosimulium sp. TaxID=3073296 RepID=A0AA51RJY5_9DIPT|nr:NADH dehydrogenase subunit 6 [Austrosimulium sp.]